MTTSFQKKKPSQCLRTGVLRLVPLEIIRAGLLKALAKGRKLNTSMNITMGIKIRVCRFQGITRVATLAAMGLDDGDDDVEVL
eukprot:2390485-Ditylum_brightwellii.AAC.1